MGMASVDETSGGAECVRGVVAVLVREGRWLMIQRAEGIVAGGAWCFPGGAIQNGESAEAALVREIREEVGLVIEAGDQVWRWVRDDGGLMIDWWTAEIVGGGLRLNPAEVQRAEWMTVDAIRSLPKVLANNLEFIAHVAAHGLGPPR